MYLIPSAHEIGTIVTIFIGEKKVKLRAIKYVQDQSAGGNGLNSAIWAHNPRPWLLYYLSSSWGQLDPSTGVFPALGSPSASECTILEPSAAAPGNNLHFCLFPPTLTRRCLWREPEGQVPQFCPEVQGRVVQCCACLEVRRRIQAW